jgi:osmotically-inducible protein OsmY
MWAEAGMIRTLLKLILILVVIVGAGAFFVGYRWATPTQPVIERPTGTSGSTPGIDQSRAREAGAEVGEKVALGVNEAQRALINASLTAKIKSKMALDDNIQARNIDVDSMGSVVTLSGVVRSSTERARALQLARETEGVTSVVDRLDVRSSQ